jgi:hypothetical protein
MGTMTYEMTTKDETNRNTSCGCSELGDVDLKKYDVDGGGKRNVKMAVNKTIFETIKVNVLLINMRYL